MMAFLDVDRELDTNKIARKGIMDHTVLKCRGQYVNDGIHINNVSLDSIFQGKLPLTLKYIGSS
jgi:hypothetical protein